MPFIDSVVASALVAIDLAPAARRVTRDQSNDVNGRRKVDGGHVAGAKLLGAHRRWPAYLAPKELRQWGALIKHLRLPPNTEPASVEYPGSIVEHDHGTLCASIAAWGERRTRYFSSQRIGSPDAARATAIVWLYTQAKDLGHNGRVLHQRTSPRNRSTGILGVCRIVGQQKGRTTSISYTVTWRDEKGRQHAKKFYAGTLATATPERERRALVAAVAFRRAYEEFVQTGHWPRGTDPT